MLIDTALADTALILIVCPTSTRALFETPLAVTDGFSIETLYVISSLLSVGVGYISTQRRFSKNSCIDVP